MSYQKRGEKIMYDCHKKKAISLYQIKTETNSSHQYTESEDAQTAHFILALSLLTIKQNKHREERVAVDIKCIQPS